MMYFIFSSPGVLGGGGCMAGIEETDRSSKHGLHWASRDSFSESVYRNLFASLQSCLET